MTDGKMFQPKIASQQQSVINIQIESVSTSNFPIIKCVCKVSDIQVGMIGMMEVTYRCIERILCVDFFKKI